MNRPRTTEEIIARAMQMPHPIAGWFVGYSGGNDSLATTHWAMTHYPQCKVLHCNTGIGIEATRVHVRNTCKQFGWPLVEIRAKEDCGQDYDELVMEHGFPGPAHHYKMYQRLKERCIQFLVRRTKRKGSNERVLIISGLRRDESKRRSGYVHREVNEINYQRWVNPLFWWTGQDVYDYIQKHNLPRNPVSEVLGMSGECLCGAYAQPGEKALVRLVCPVTATRLDNLEIKVRQAGHNWGWEDAPPPGAIMERKELKRGQRFMPFCVGCEK
jgi:3'-phosphoadenosine 5'-phosphosulfate sulfotransferase (PAPS reductase)/FAD synthetase